MSSDTHNIVLKFGKEIKGSSSIKGYEDWILVDSYSMSSGRALTMVKGTQNRTIGTGQMSELLLSKGSDKASADIFMQSLCGDSLGEATLRVLDGSIKDKQRVVMELKMHDVMVSHFSSTASLGRPVESFQLSFMLFSIQTNQSNGEKEIVGTPKVWDLRNSVQG
ncbi:type VI protein secretion system component Hcp [Luteibacter rhizovicinus]|uniref:Type VI protein secretion system component Hcp n=1 Tax=Luteibacter rhizovicinus TaxID=242606 RepID=A0A4R3YW48_9GAMM|nr:type VI secretion system tube protein Hcp [Luteibacter rhizovicinus]TCV97297.1 type VI protein secretion system component Hcp [Luteibacter rhizovicinus]